MKRLFYTLKPFFLLAAVAGYIALGFSLAATHFVLSLWMLLAPPLAMGVGIVGSIMRDRWRGYPEAEAKDEQAGV